MLNKLTFTAKPYILAVSIFILFAAWAPGDCRAQDAGSIINTMRSLRNMDQRGGATQAPRRGPSSNNGGDGSTSGTELPHVPSAKERREQERQEAQNRLHREERDRLVQKNWVQVSPTDSVVLPGKSVPITPGTHFFNTLPSDPGSLTAPIAHAAMNGTPIPRESLRRTVVILAAAMARLQGTSPSDEEISFLSQQAAFALEGAPLQVIVSPAAGLEAIKAAEDLRPVIEDIGQQEAIRERANATRNRTLKDYAEFKKGEGAAGADPMRNFQKHQTLSDNYDKASGQASAAKEQLGHDTLEVTIIIERLKQ
jgi:hypothetical protein